MFRSSCGVYAAAIIGVLILWGGSAIAGEVFLQPRLETGVMEYTFKSQAINQIEVSQPVPEQSGFSITQTAFDFSGFMPFVSAGATAFVNRFFLDLCGQYGWGGDDSASIASSGFTRDPDSFLAFETDNAASFDRGEAAVSIGYAFTRRFNLFTGYKWARTNFDTTFDGRYSFVIHNSNGPDNYLAGRYWGAFGYRFEYEGPFVGAIHSWDCTHFNILPGAITVNLALAHLQGKVKVDRRDQHVTIDSVDGQPIPAVTGEPENGMFARLDTKGETWGLSAGLGWCGTTPLEGLSYTLGISGYRYEFDSDRRDQSDINETVMIYRVGLAYVF